MKDLFLMVSLVLCPIFWVEQARGDEADAFRSLYQRPKAIPQPHGNEYTKDRYELGRMLFFDPRLSRSNWISCATCHNPALAWGDGLPVGIGDGMKELRRRTPTILNAAWLEVLMWDGRAGSLEEQAMGPVSSQAEMNLNVDDLIRKLKAISGYQPLFEKAYPGEGIQAPTISKAIAVFERQIVSSVTSFDRWVEGHDAAIGESAKRGFVLFNTKALCSKCHSGWRFTDDSFHDIGVSGDDKGRGDILPTIPVLQYAFKTPTLRNLDGRGPFFHNGSEPDLSAVLAFYNDGGKAKRENQSEHVKPLGLTKSELQDLKNFLTTLNGRDTEMSVPALPH